MKTVGGEVEDASGETNMCAYLAVGVWHHWLLRRDEAFVERMWPVVDGGSTSWSALQLPSAASPGRRRGTDGPASTATRCWPARRASTRRCAPAWRIAELLDEPQPDWELAGGRLGHALREHRDRFLDKATFSMDWYYPVLGGAVRGRPGTT